MQSPTATTNTSLPFVDGRFDTLVEGLDYAARGETGFNYYSVRGELLHRLPYSELRASAMVLARRLNGLGLARGARVAVVAETTPDFHRFFFACQYAGLVPVPVPVPINLGGKDAYVLHVRGMIAAAGASLAVASSDLVGMLREATADLDLVMVDQPAAFDALADDGELRPVGPGDPCYIQYSSGSTSAPKGVLVSQRSAVANAHGIIAHGLRVRAGDRCVSWLPLYHDMGLVGFCIAPVLSQLSVDYLSTVDFARRSLIWLQLISENRGTIAFSPSFGYDLCASRGSRGAGAAASFDLSSWRVAGIGGDMVRADVLQRFAETFARHGFDATAFTPSYGLAESTLAVSFADLETPFETDRVDLARYEETGLAKPVAADEPAEYARSFVLCGRPMPEHEFRILDDDDRPLPDRRVGRLMIKGPSVAQGYFGDAAATLAVFTADGWLDTGDLAHSISCGQMLRPLQMIRSLRRPVSTSLPSIV